MRINFKIGKNSRISNAFEFEPGGKIKNGYNQVYGTELIKSTKKYFFT